HVLETAPAQAPQDTVCVPPRQEAAGNHTIHWTLPATVEEGLRSRDVSTPAGGNSTLPWTGRSRYGAQSVEPLGLPGRGEDAPKSGPTDYPISTPTQS